MADVKDQTAEVFDPVAEGLTTEGYPGGKPLDKTDYFDPLDFARPSFEAAKERFMDAGKIDVDPEDPALYTAFKRSMDYLADTGMAGLELSDAAFKAAVGTVAELVPGQSQEQEKRLERDLYSMPEAFLGVSPGRIQQATDTVAEGVKNFASPPTKPVKTSTFNTNLYSEEDFGDNLVEQGGMLVDSSFDVYTPDTLEEALALKVSDFKEGVKNFTEGSISGEGAKAKLKALEKLGDDFFLTAAESIPHYNDQMYGEYLERLKNISKENDLDFNYVIELVQDLDSDFQSIYGKKIDPVIRDVATRVLPDQQRIGERASDWWYLEGSPQRPSDTKASDLNFTDTVYHSSVAPKEFTRFNLDKSYVEGSQRSAQDFLGVHVGTPRAAAERNLDAVRNSDEPVGFTMELKARTDKPFTKAKAKKLFKGFTPKGNDTFSEEDINNLIGAQAEELFKNSEEILPENYRTLSAIELRKKLAKEGYTHIPYINDVEDPGSTSFIMLVDRPKNSPAVLRDVRAQFDPEKITDPDLRFAEGGLAVEEQMNKLYQEGGLADDGTDIEPVTGNEVPTGSMDQEVRDNIPAQLSEGEYVVPADVVRYYGVKFFEDLRGQAKQDFARMEAEGRVGGEPVDTNGMPTEENEELTPEEMQMLAEALGQAPAAPTGMAMGGMVPQQQTYDPYAQQQMQYTQPMFQSARSGMAVGGAAKAIAQAQRPMMGQQSMSLGQMSTYYNPQTGELRSLMPGQEPPKGFEEMGENPFAPKTPKPTEFEPGGSGLGPDDVGMPETAEISEMDDATLGKAHTNLGRVSTALGMIAGPLGLPAKAAQKAVEVEMKNRNMAVPEEETMAQKAKGVLGIETPEEDTETEDTATEAAESSAEAAAEGPDTGSDSGEASGGGESDGGDAGGDSDGEGESRYQGGLMGQPAGSAKKKPVKQQKKKRSGLGSK